MSSENGKVLATITNVHVGNGRVIFDRLALDKFEDETTPGAMSDDELLISFLEGRAFRLGEATSP